MLQTGLVNSKSIKIGALLVKAGVVAPDSLAIALQTSRAQDRPVGSVLVKLAKLRQKDLSSALYLQSLVNEGIMTVKVAIEALNRCHKNDIDAATALKELFWQPEIEQKPDTICQLMIDSGFVSERLHQEVCAADQAVSGFSFVMRGVVSCAHFNEILHAASFVQQNIVTNADAIEALIGMRKNAVPVTEMLGSMGVYVKKDAPRIGSLMVSAGVMGESELLIALERSLRAQQRLGEYLIGSGTLSSHIMQACLDTQTLLASGVIEREQAVNLIKLSAEQNKPISQITRATGVLREDEARAVAVVRMLRNADVISQGQMDQLEAISQQMNCGQVAALAMRGFITKNMYKTAWAALRAMEQCEIRVDEAVVILQVCSRLNCNFREGMMQVALKQEEQQAHVVDESGAYLRPHMDIKDAEIEGKRQQSAQRSSVFAGLLMATALALWAVHYFVPQLPLELLCGIFVICLAGCLKELVKWESEDAKRVEEVNLTVSVARRTSQRLKKVSL